MAEGSATRRRAATFLILAGLLAAGYISRSMMRGGSAALDFDAVEVEVVPVTANVYVLVSVAGEVAAGNTLAQIGPDGVLLVDTQYHQLGEKLLATLARLTDEPVTYIVNTHVHIDHVGGNEILSHNGVLAGPGKQSAREAPVLAHGNVLERLMGPPPQGRRREIWPTISYVSAAYEFPFNGELVRVIHQPAAHTDGDSIIYLTGSRVISAGDIFNNRSYPFVSHANGGSLRGVIDSLAYIVELAADPRTRIVPGHGEVADRETVAEYRQMLITIRDRIEFMSRSGMSLSEIQAARPTAEFDERYGRDSGFWTTRDFVEAVHQQVVLESGSRVN